MSDFLKGLVQGYLRDISKGIYEATSRLNGSIEVLSEIVRRLDTRPVAVMIVSGTTEEGRFVMYSSAITPIGEREVRLEVLPQTLIKMIQVTVMCDIQRVNVRYAAIANVPVMMGAGVSFTNETAYPGISIVAVVESR